MTAAVAPHHSRITYRDAHARLLKTVTLWCAAFAVPVALTLVIAGRTDLLLAALGAYVVSNLAAVGSVPLLAWGLSGPPSRTGAAYLLSTAIRSGVSLVGGLFLATAGGLPEAATLLMIVPFYFVILAAECTVLGRVLWNAPGEITQ